MGQFRRAQGWESALTRQIDFTGKSGTVYRYTALDEGRALPPAGANYLIVEDAQGETRILFAGETDNLSRSDWRGPLAQARARHEGAEVLTRLNVRGAVRQAERDDLIEAHLPAMNDRPVRPAERESQDAGASAGGAE
jgi:hypothetical protein